MPEPEPNLTSASGMDDVEFDVRGAIESAARDAALSIALQLRTEQRLNDLERRLLRLDGGAPAADSPTIKEAEEARHAVAGVVPVTVPIPMDLVEAGPDTQSQSNRAISFASEESYRVVHDHQLQVTPSSSPSMSGEVVQPNDQSRRSVARDQPQQGFSDISTAAGEETRLRKSYSLKNFTNNWFYSAGKDNDEDQVALIIGNRTMMACEDVFSHCIARAISPGSRWTTAVSFMFFMVVFSCFQVVILASVILESSFMRCTENNDCLQGEWCSPALGDTFTTNPGVCFDCWSTTMFYQARFLNGTYETYPDPYEKMAAAAGDPWLLAGSAHCNATDTKPRQCDHLVHSRTQLSRLGCVVLFTITMLVVSTVLDDLDEVAESELLLGNQIRHVKTLPRRYVINFLSWIGFMLRLYILPMFLIAATAGLLLRAALTSWNMLLNGMAITFVTTMDNTLGTTFFMKHVEADPVPELPIAYGHWLLNRIYAVALVACLWVTVMYAEDLLSEYGNERKYGSMCSDVREILTVAASRVCLVCACMRPVLTFTYRWTDRETKLREKSYKIHFVHMYGDFLPFLPVNIWYWIAAVAWMVFDAGVSAYLVVTLRNEFIGQGPMVMLQVSGRVN